MKCEEESCVLSAVLRAPGELNINNNNFIKRLHMVN